jgi:MFS superfamily sulfate permease-like transporter
MQIIDTKTHGYIDYIFGLTLIAIAYLLNFNTANTPNIALYIVGASAIVYSLFTNYELGVIKIIPMNIHLMLDSLSGIFLAVSPWLLGFSDKVFLPHLIFGLIEIGTTVITRFKPRYKVNTNQKKLNHNRLQRN